MRMRRSNNVTNGQGLKLTAVTAVIRSQYFGQYEPPSPPFIVLSFAKKSESK